MTLSDHLDMVGVTLMATWTKTRKENGDTIQTKIKNTVNPWKAGKFLPITQRGWSLNTYALSKVWFKAKSVDLRVADIKNITSSCKSWLYQDMLLKPEEMLLHRPPSYGGLGLHSVKCKALAGFISTFMQTAANPRFQPSLLHNLLYRKHVLLEDVQGVPHLPPYLSPELFTVMRKVKDHSKLNITNMSEGDWTRYLTEDLITMERDDEDGDRHFLPSRVELANPLIDWELSWQLCRQPGIPPELTSFLWKMLLDLLCTQQRLHRVGASMSSICKLCKDDTGTQEHELILCSLNNNIGLKLLSTLQYYIPTMTSNLLLHLSLPDIETEHQLPACLLIATTLSCIWTARTTSSRVCAFKVRSELEQTINLLRTTRISDSANILSIMLYHMFQ